MSPCSKIQQAFSGSFLAVLILPLVWNQDVVDSSQLDVDLEAEVREGLRGRLHHVLHLHTLRGHAQQGVPHPLHLSCGSERGDIPLKNCNHC